MQVEYVNEIDENDNEMRKVSHQEMREKNLRHREVLVLIIDHQDNFLLQKRSKTKAVLPGYFQCAAGGCVRAGETYETAAARELKEELGISSIKLDYLFEYKGESKHAKVICQVYYCFYEGPLRIDPVEVERALWLPIAEIENFIENNQFGNFNKDIFRKFYNEYFKKRIH